MKRLIAIQQELKAPKNQKNSFGGYNYRSCEDILEAVKPLLKKQGLALTISDEICNIGERYYIRAVAQLFDGEKTHDNLIAETVAYAREEETKKGMDASQLTGSTSSYARKYALNGLFAIDDTKDSDATNTHGKETKQEIKKTSDKDKEFYEVVSTMNNADDIKEYYTNTKLQVDDREAYHKLVLDRLKELKGNK